MTGLVPLMVIGQAVLATAVARRAGAGRLEVALVPVVLVLACGPFAPTDTADWVAGVALLAAIALAPLQRFAALPLVAATAGLLLTHPLAPFATDLATRLSPFTTQWVNLPHWYALTAHALALEGLFAGLAFVAAAALAGRRSGESTALAGGVLVAFLLAMIAGAPFARVACLSGPAIAYAAVLATRWRRALQEPALMGVAWLPVAGMAGLAIAGALLAAVALRHGGLG